MNENEQNAIITIFVGKKYLGEKDNSNVLIFVAFSSTLEKNTIFLVSLDDFLAWFTSSKAQTND